MYSSANESQLIEEHVGLVRRIGLQLVARLPANVELDDLLQAGMMGLLDAIRRYQPSDDARFETYASTRIRGAMLDELRSQDWLPRSVRSSARQIEAAIQQLQDRLLRQPSEAEIAQELDLSLDDYQALLASSHGMQVLHYEDFLRQNEGKAGSEAIPAVQSMRQQIHDDPIHQLLAQGLRELLVDAISELPERERLLLSLQFEEDLNQKEIGAVMGISEGRVSQLRSQAIARIRAYIAAQSWAVTAQDSSYHNLL